MTKKANIKRSSKQWPCTDRNNRLARVVDFVNEDEGSEPLLTEKDITPAIPAQAIKESISDQRLGVAIEKICLGQYTVDQLLKKFDLTDAQLTTLDTSITHGSPL